jgi:hypothetical protein
LLRLPKHGKPLLAGVPVFAKIAVEGERVAKKDTKAHRRHTKTGMTDANKHPETSLDELDKLATPTSGSEGGRAIQSEDDHDTRIKKRLWLAVQTIRNKVAAGDARWAAYWGIQAGVLAHELGWSEKDAERGQKVLDGQKKSRVPTGKKSKAHRQKVLDQVRAQHKGWTKTRIRREAAERCDCTPRTIVRSTDWK